MGLNKYINYIFLNYYNKAIKSMKSFPDAKMLKQNQPGIEGLQYLLDAQGQCKISSIDALNFKCYKFIPVLIISIITIIPGIILLNFKKARKVLLYSACSFEEADHLYIQTSDGNHDLVSIIKQGSQNTFIFKQLKYFLEGSDHFPMVMNYRSHIKQTSLDDIIKKGLNNQQVQRQKKRYGKNIHVIQIENYFSYMASVIFQPLYILQYIVVLSLSAQGLPLFGIILVIASLITTSGNYIALYINKRKIRQMAQKQSQVQVIRNSQRITIQSSNLVPGDIIVFNSNSQISCDCVVLQGQLFVNESSLTGQNIPIKKTSYVKNLQNHQVWLYDGTKVLEANQIKAMVIFTGFSSKKGRLLRKILNRIPVQPDFFMKMFAFLLQSFIIGMILYGATMPIRLAVNIDKGIVALRALDYLISSVPPAFPVYFTIAYSWSLYRLKKKQIFSTMPQKTVQSNRLKTACFDKTGTLTSNNLIFKGFYCLSKNGPQQLKLNIKSQQLNFIKTIFGTCHSVRVINQQNQGDQVDLRLWQISNFKFGQKNVFVNENQQKYTVIVLNQFQSRFQSMSALIKQQKTGKHYVFVKGAPQKIRDCSLNKYDYYNDFLSQMSFKGLRTIAFGWKMVNQSEVSGYLTKQRDQFLNNIQLIGIGCFENPLKYQTVHTIENLRKANINTRIITGDNIFIAVQIAFQAKILQYSSQVLIVQGKKFKEGNRQKIFEVLIANKSSGSIQIVKSQYTLSKIYQTGMPTAIDNDFMSTQQFNVTKNMKVFARILPSNKAKIIEYIKQQFQAQYNSRGCLEKIFGQGRDKVAMIGDGANDLMAIKEADVGVGINGTDAVYSSAFSIPTLDCFIYILSEGKCTTLNIIECLKFTIVANYINLVVEILLATQATFISQFQGLYINFLIIILVPIIMSLSGPYKRLVPNKVKDNFMGWQNQLSVWLTILILGGGLVGSYFFVTNTPTYVPNPDPKWQIGIGYNFNCQLVTAIFLAEGLALSALGWIISQGQPFKKIIFRNIILTIVLAVNFVAFTAYFFIVPSSQIGFLNLLSMVIFTSGIQYAIVMVSILIAFMFNILLHKNRNKIIESNEINVNQTLMTTSIQLGAF